MLDVEWLVFDGVLLMEKQFDPLFCLDESHRSLTSINYESTFCRSLLANYTPA